MLAKSSEKHNQVAEQINDGVERGCPACGSVSIVRYGYYKIESDSSVRIVKRHLRI